MFVMPKAALFLLLAGCLVTIGVGVSGLAARPVAESDAQRLRRPAGAAPLASTAAKTPEPPPKLLKVDRSGLLYAPKSCGETSGRLDMVFHFHGVPHVVADALQQARVRAALHVVNEGLLSDSYEDAWSAAGSFERLVSDTEQRLAGHCGRNVSTGRVALSSFSAGFAAVQQLLAENKVARQVDAVLLADSLYAAYTNPGSKQLSTQGLQPFVDFAQAALRGDKMMAVTHSAIPTEGYASTVETADYLLRELHLERQPSKAGGTRAEAGQFSLRGIPGADKAAHELHLQRMGETVFRKLWTRWQAHDPQ